MQDSKFLSRRNFIRNTSVAGISTIAIPQIVSASFSEEKAGTKIRLSDNDVILFQGDSITDSGRKKDVADANHTGAMGSGYAMIASSHLLKEHPGKNLKIFNRGISGNKVYQLAERWNEDCILLAPKVLSILIGVNDFWHMINGKYNGNVTTYTNDYTSLLESTIQKLPGVKLIIGEPFAVSGIKAVDEKWYPAFNDYRAAARDIANKFDAIFIPYQNIFDKAQKLAPGVYWTADGVHPSLAGVQLMAEAWLQTIQ